VHSTTDKDRPASGQGAVAEGERPATFCAAPGGHQPVCDMVAAAVERYLVDLDGTEPTCIYELVMKEVERPLLKTVLAHAGGNRSKASKYLGMNRNTLRKKLEQYQIDD